MTNKKLLTLNLNEKKEAQPLLNALTSNLDINVESVVESTPSKSSRLDKKELTLILEL